MSLSEDVEKGPYVAPTIDKARIEESRRKIALDYARSFSNPTDSIITVVKKAEDIYKYLYK